MHVHVPPGIAVAAIEIWIALNVMVLLSLVAPSRKAARFLSITIFAMGWMAVCGALRFLP